MQLLADCGGRTVALDVQAYDLVEEVSARFAEQAQLPVAAQDTVRSRSLLCPCYRCACPVLLGVTCTS